MERQQTSLPVIPVRPLAKDSVGIWSSNILRSSRCKGCALPANRGGRVYEVHIGHSLLSILVSFAGMFAGAF